MIFIIESVVVSNFGLRLLSQGFILETETYTFNFNLKTNSFNFFVPIYIETETTLGSNIFDVFIMNLLLKVNLALVCDGEGTTFVPLEKQLAGLNIQMIMISKEFPEGMKYGNTGHQQATVFVQLPMIVTTNISQSH